MVRCGIADNLLASVEQVKQIQDETGKYVACLEEIAYRRGYIADYLLNHHAENLNNTLYDEYLRCLACE